MYRTLNTLALLTLFFLGCFGLNATAIAFPSHTPVPGGVATLSIAPDSAPRPVVHYQDERVTVAPYDKKWVAIIGIPLDARAGQHAISITNPTTQKTFEAPFEVSSKRYRLQRLTIRNKNKVNPNRKSTQRILRELKIQNKLKNRYSERAASLNFMQPVRGRNTGRFGLRRIINGQKRNPHSGMDIAAPTGTPVKATAAGQVIHTDDFFFTGKVVYLDHGSGVISLYAHLSRINVKPGQWLKRGEILGRVGSTGRATGPHLHWSIYLNGQAVDPHLFIPKRN